MPEFPVGYRSLPWYFPEDFGDTSLGADSALAIQKAMDYASTTAGNPADPSIGADVVLQAKRYYTRTTLQKRNGVRLIGVGNALTDAPAPPCEIQSYIGLAGPVIDVSNAINYAIENISLRSFGQAGSRGIYGSTQTNGRIFRVFCSGFAEEGILIGGGVHIQMQHVWTQNCLMNRIRGAYAGSIDLACHDADLHLVYASTSSNALDSGSGANVGLVIRGGNARLIQCRPQFSETGLYIAATAANGRVSDCILDLHQGHGIIYAGSNFEFSHNLLQDCGRSANNTWDGLSVQGGNGANVCFNRVTNVAAPNKVRYGFADGNNAAGVELGNTYYGNRGAAACATGLELYTGTGANGNARLLGRDFVVGRGLVDAQGVAGLYTAGAGKVTALDADFPSGAPRDGAMAVILNTTDGVARIAVRAGGTWRVVGVA